MKGMWSGFLFLFLILIFLASLAVLGLEIVPDATLSSNSVASVITSIITITPNPTNTPLVIHTPTPVATPLAPTQANAPNTSVIVAMITSVSALIGAVFAAILSFLTARKMQRLEARKIVANFLLEKKQSLENAQRRIRDEIEIIRPKNQITDFWEIADVTSKTFSLYSSIFEDVKHLLPRNVVNELETLREEIALIKTQGILATLPGEFPSLSGEQLGKLLELMRKFWTGVDKAISEALRATVEEISKMDRL